MCVYIYTHICVLYTYTHTYWSLALKPNHPCFYVLLHGQTNTRHLKYHMCIYICIYTYYISMHTYVYIVDFHKQLEISSLLLHQRSANFSCKGLGSKYFKLCELYSRYHNYSTLPSQCKTTHRQHKNKWGWLGSNKTSFIQTDN